MKPFFRIPHPAFSVLFLLAMAGPLAAEPVPCEPATWRQAENHVFAEHEAWRFEVEWGILSAGEAVLASEGIETINGRPAYHLSMDIKAGGVVGSLHPYRDRTDSWLDKDSLITVVSSQSIRQHGYQVDRTVTLDPTCQSFEVHENRIHENRLKEHNERLPANTLDAYGALYYLRTLPLSEGFAYEFTLLAGAQTIPVKAVVKRQEKVKVPAGSFECYLVEVATQDAEAAKKFKKFQWWVSTDERHIPVRLRMQIGIGHIAGELASLNGQSVKPGN